MPADDLFVFTDDVVVDVFAFDTDEVVWQNDKQFFKKRNRKLEKKRTQKNQPSVISNCRRFRRNQWLQWRLRLQLQIINVLKNDGCKEKTHIGGTLVRSNDDDFRIFLLTRFDFISHHFIQRIHVWLMRRIESAAKKC